MPKAPQRPLNGNQELAAAHLTGPMLVRAGAGTGKTTVLVERICRLIVEEHAKPEQILAVTYTEEAAREMRDRARKRVEEKLGPGAADGLRTGTFHASCNEILKRNHADFEVLDDKNLWVYLRRQMDRRALPLQKFLNAANPAKFLHDFLNFFDRCSDELVDASRYRDYVAGLRQGTQSLPRVSTQKEADELSREEVLARCEEIASVYSAVERLLNEKNLGTFGLMIVNAVQLLRDQPELLKREQERTRFLLIDEFQDCNAAQIEFAQLLGGASQNVFAVGDPDQAIYRFRGASSGAFDEFLRRFPSAKTITLGENYRSTDAILKAAFALISTNPDVQSSGVQAEPRRQLQPANTATQPELFSRAPVDIVLNKKNHDEAYDLAEAIGSLQKKNGTRWSNFAALYRSHAHRLELIKELAARSIPYVVVGVDLLNTAVLRDLVAILRALHQFPDDISLFRLALMPRFGIELNELQRQLSETKGKSSTMISVLDNMPAGKKLLRSLKELQSLLGVERSPTSKVLTGVIKYLQMHSEREEVKIFSDFVAKWEALSITETGRLPEFIEYLDYFIESGGCLKSEKLENVDAVCMMTVHAAKGLEFDHVFVLRVCSPSFPSSFQPPLFEFPDALRAAGNTAGLADSKILHEEEERRAFYVGMTRARKTLALHGRAARGKDPVPSKFLRELTNNKSAKNVFAIRDALPARFAIAASSQSPTEAEWLTMAPKKDWGNQPLSHYLLDLYDTCPLQFKLARDWNLPSEPAAMMQFGAVIHRVLADYYNSVMKGAAYSNQQVLKMFMEQLAASGMEDPLQRDLYAKQGIEQLERFLSESSAHLLPNVLGTEQSFAVEIGGVTIRGRIDRIDRITADAVELIDYKTGRAKKQDEADKSLQLAIYAIAAKRQWNHSVERIVFHNLEDNSRVETNLSAKKIAGVEEKIIRAAQDMREGKFEAKPGFHCKWCGYRQLCPATEETLHTIATATAATVP